MKIIDFDEQFHRYAENWIRLNAARFSSMDEMEAHIPDAYETFIETPADWLDGLSPRAWFENYADPRELIALLRAYEAAGVSAPDLLLERLTDLKEASVEPLMALAADETACACLRVTALNLLIELNTERPAELCLALIDAREEKDELADVAAELLQNLGQSVTQAMLSRLDGASRAALDTYLDLLCNFPGDERIYSYTVREFLLRPDQRALFASYLGKLGDERALEALKTVFAQDDVNYLDYLEIANAIEMLGGEAGERTRDFTGDPYFESMRDMQ